MARHDWEDTPDGELLATAAIHGTNFGHLLELGSDVGDGSTLILGKIAEKYNGLLWCVDTYCGWYGHDVTEPNQIKTGQWRNERVTKILSAFCRNVEMALLWDSVRMLRMSSAEAFNLMTSEMRFGFVLIDGHHTAPIVDYDFETWPQRVCPGGVLAAHDVNLPPVAAAIEHWLQRDGAKWEPFGLAKRLKCWKRIT